jgi:hypothetical protein
VPLKFDYSAADFPTVWLGFAEPVTWIEGLQVADWSCSSRDPTTN